MPEPGYGEFTHSRGFSAEATAPIQDAVSKLTHVSSDFRRMIIEISTANDSLSNTAPTVGRALDSLIESLQGDDLESMHNVAIDELLKLRSTVDDLSRAMLYSTWSRRLKEHLDESMQEEKWVFPAW